MSVLVYSWSCDAYRFGCLMVSLGFLTEIGFPPHVEFGSVQPLTLNYFQNSLFPFQGKSQ